MIPKGNQRAGGRQLATHLMNAYDNERVEIAEIRGALAQDLHGAFAEWRSDAGATKCRKYLYSLSLNPDPEQGILTREQYLDFIRRTEQKLGLADQPRAVIFHVKQGREHCHVVWSRIDAEKLRAVQLSHDRQKLRDVAQGFARDHGLELPRSMQKNRGKERYADRQKRENLPEKQQEERTGVTKQERLAEITAAWKQSDTGRSFVTALEERGYLLARGERRGYVVVDLYGEIHSLSRYVEGAKAKDIKERLKDYALDGLPDAATAQAHARQRRERLQQDRQQETQEPAQPARSERADTLKRAQQSRREALALKRTALQQQHKTEISALRELQQAQTAAVFRQRQEKQPRGLAAFLVRITGINALVQLRHGKQDKERTGQQGRQSDALQRRHKRELADIDRRARALGFVEKREARSLRTAWRREQNKSLKRAAELDRAGKQRERLGQLQQNAADITKPKEHQQQAHDTLPPKFNEAAKRIREQTAESSSRKPERDRTQDLTDKNLSRDFNAPDSAPPEQPEPQRQTPQPVRAEPFPVPKLEPKAPPSARARFEEQRRDLLAQQAAEREKLEGVHQRWEASVEKQRTQEHAKEQGKGLLAGLLSRISGAPAKTAEHEQTEDRERHEKQDRQTKGQEYRHKQERDNLEREYRATEKLQQEAMSPKDPLTEALKRRQAQNKREREQEEREQRRKGPDRDRGR